MYVCVKNPIKYVRHNNNNNNGGRAIITKTTTTKSSEQVLNNNNKNNSEKGKTNLKNICTTVRKNTNVNSLLEKYIQHSYIHAHVCVCTQEKQKVYLTVK